LTPRFDKHSAVDAAGDVLRSTSILPAFKKNDPGLAIWWITENSSKPLLEKNPYIDVLLGIDPALPVLRPRSLAAALGAPFRQQRLLAILLGTFSAIAVALAGARRLALARRELHDSV
jgi:ADP-heptose:LPS heptosyltransferase